MSITYNSPTTPKKQKSKLWFEVFQYLPFLRKSNYVVNAMLLGIFAYIVVGSTSLAVGQLNLFFHTGLGYLGAFNVFWAALAVSWFFRGISRQLDSCRLCFTVSDEEWGIYKNRFISSMRSTRPVIIIGLVLFPLFVLLNSVAFLQPAWIPIEIRNVLQISTALPKGWFEGNTVLNMLPWDVGFFIVATFLASAVWMTLIGIRSFTSLSSLAVSPLPSLIAIKLKSFSTFFVISSFMWATVITSSFVITSFKPENGDYLLIGIFLGGTLAFFVVPQFFFQEIIKKSRERLADIVLRITAKVVNGIEDEAKISPLAELLSANDVDNTWAYNFDQVFALIFSQGLPLIGLILKQLLLNNFVGF